MNQMTSSEFKKLPKPLNGVFIFIKKSTCGICEKYIKRIEKYYRIRSKDWTIVDAKREDMKWAQFEIMLKGVPCTRFYFNNKVEFERAGALYPKQIETMIEIIKVCKFEI